MPLSVNVGLSRKASKDYQSSGVSINLTAELDQTLLARPVELKQQVLNLYQQAEAALDRQAAPANPEPPSRPSANGLNGHGNGNGHHSRTGHNQHRNGEDDGPPATASQLRAIRSIAQRLNVDPDREARDIAGSDLDRLSLRQASDLIDHLKGLRPAQAQGGRNGGGR